MQWRNGFRSAVRSSNNTFKSAALVHDHRYSRFSRYRKSHRKHGWAGGLGTLLFWLGQRIFARHGPGNCRSLFSFLPCSHSMCVRIMWGISNEKCICGVVMCLGKLWCVAFRIANIYPAHEEGHGVSIGVWPRYIKKRTWRRRVFLHTFTDTNHRPHTHTHIERSASTLLCKVAT